MPQEQPTEEAKEKVFDGKGKRKLKKAPTEPSKDSSPFPLRQARREVVENKLKEERWLQKQEILLLVLELLNLGALLSLSRWINIL